MHKTVYLVRHCQATGQEPQAELTEKGKEQAKELMRFLEKRNIKHIISSPFTRAIQSIQPTAERLGLQVEIDSRLAEEKLVSKNLKDWLERLEESIRDIDLKMAGGESSREVANRGMEVLETATDGTVLATHRNTMGLLLMKIDGMQGIKEWASLSHPDVYEVKVRKDSYYVRRIWG
ncbi:histidine phosphatase family protein [Sporosarcina sp. Te-1]|uniref:histidine phosphatase family protein n=1 Tax=Sporosarcina sp. Te-1 TaxID=2818390 RepID=UPI001A9ED5A5|nr:histidine phosphatase family protein [Sporosarcina sp. Te-1]QTD39737.1 histidine phosphatase family protein [Sporosarcina sp. Te-1]